MSAQSDYYSVDAALQRLNLSPASKETVICPSCNNSFTRYNDKVCCSYKCFQKLRKKHQRGKYTKHTLPKKLNQFQSKFPNKKLYTSEDDAWEAVFDTEHASAHPPTGKLGAYRCSCSFWHIGNSTFQKAMTDKIDYLERKARANES